MERVRARGGVSPALAARARRARRGSPRGGSAGGGPAPARGRRLPAHSLEGGLPAALPQPGELLPGALVARWTWRPRHGAAPRALLRRLLLGADAADVRRRDHERAHDGGALRLHPRRTPVAGRSVGLSGPGHGDDRVGCAAARVTMRRRTRAPARRPAPPVGGMQKLLTSTPACASPSVRSPAGEPFCMIACGAGGY